MGERSGDLSFVKGSRCVMSGDFSGDSVSTEPLPASVQQCSDNVFHVLYEYMYVYSQAHVAKHTYETGPKQIGEGKTMDRTFCSVSKYCVLKCARPIISTQPASGL